MIPKAISITQQDITMVLNILLSFFNQAGINISFISKSAPRKGSMKNKSALHFIASVNSSFAA